MKLFGYNIELVITKIKSEAPQTGEIWLATKSCERFDIASGTLGEIWSAGDNKITIKIGSNTPSGWRYLHFTNKREFIDVFKRVGEFK